MKILVSDSLSKQGVELLEQAGFTVVVKSKMPDRMPRSWRMVISSPFGMPSTKVASVSSSLSLP